MSPAAILAIPVVFGLESSLGYDGAPGSLQRFKWERPGSWSPASPSHVRLAIWRRRSATSATFLKGSDPGVAATHCPVGPPQRGVA